VFHGNLTVKQE